MSNLGLLKSISKKGSSPNNSAYKVFFGQLNNEILYNQDWTEISVKDFIEIFNTYLKWYNKIQIKISLRSMSPLEYKRSL